MSLFKNGCFGTAGTNRVGYRIQYIRGLRTQLQSAGRFVHSKIFAPKQTLGMEASCSKRRPESVLPFSCTQATNFVFMKPPMATVQTGHNIRKVDEKQPEVLSPIKVAMEKTVVSVRGSPHSDRRSLTPRKRPAAQMEGISPSNRIDRVEPDGLRTIVAQEFLGPSRKLQGLVSSQPSYIDRKVKSFRKIFSTFISTYYMVLVIQETRRQLSGDFSKNGSHIAESYQPQWINCQLSRSMHDC